MHGSSWFQTDRSPSPSYWCWCRVRAHGARVLACGVAVLALALAIPSPAAAAPPPNDQRTAPQILTLPASVAGTTAESTLEADEPPGCVPLGGSVFYEVRAPSDERIVVRLDAAGDLDATLEIFRRVRSVLEPINCELTDRRGQAGFQFRPVRDGIYLVRVGQRAGSVAGRFRLDVFAPVPPPRPPGSALRARGVSRTLDSLQDTSDAWSFRMRAGTTYRLNLAAGPCMSLLVYSPGTRDFESEAPVARAGCDGYLLFTPAAGESGRYSLVVNAHPRRRGPQTYHLQAARAGVDDTAPGLPLPNYRRVRGSLRGRAVDAVDLYRFSLTRRSAVELTLRHGGSGTMTLTLLSDTGRRLSRGSSEISGRMVAGRYFVAVRTGNQATGGYTLRRVSRTITRTSISIDGERHARAAPGRTVRIAANVAPSATGPVTVTIERLDPLAGWQFHREIRITARAGSAQTGFLPPSVGRWRASARFEGTREFAPSRSSSASVLVAAPLGT
jgi:hypothetical protein